MRVRIGGGEEEVEEAFEGEGVGSVFRGDMLATCEHPGVMKLAYQSKLLSRLCSVH